jgi:hypothetical protein
LGGSGNEIGLFFISKLYDWRKNSVGLTTDMLERFQNLFGLEPDHPQNIAFSTGLAILQPTQMKMDTQVN